MTNLDKIYNHWFTLEMGNDLSPKDIVKEDYTELEYYVKNTQFYFVHFLSLLSQLDNAVGLSSGKNVVQIYGKKRLKNSRNKKE